MDSKLNNYYKVIKCIIFIVPFLPIPNFKTLPVDNPWVSETIRLLVSDYQKDQMEMEKANVDCLGS